MFPVTEPRSIHLLANGFGLFTFDLFRLYVHVWRVGMNILCNQWRACRNQYLLLGPRDWTQVMRLGSRSFNHWAISPALLNLILTCFWTQFRYHTLLDFFPWPHQKSTFFRSSHSGVFCNQGLRRTMYMFTNRHTHHKISLNVCYVIINILCPSPRSSSYKK